MLASSDKGSLRGYARRRGSGGGKLIEIHREAANKQTHRNVGLLTGRPPGGPGCQSLTRVLAKQKIKQRVREKRLITGTGRPSPRGSDPGTDNTTTEKGNSSKRSEGQRIKEERGWRAGRSTEANNNKYPSHGGQEVPPPPPNHLAEVCFRRWGY